ncbi:hypothetical protein [Emergencia sp. 1XD21-10]|uniref:hypothetical protein n=1 Tax=Emergencia sp. 1XD21-10 TaxID=2304569 RepID=UPI00192A3B44|nr:hypothetical protein [Emergencia sp. 1XD21-10]NCE99667.1 hypothetical protein [Emergencia sp. 1XD21-10]
MASWNNVTKTEQGLALEQKLLTQEKPLRLVSARSGAGKVNPTQLVKQTAVSDPKQTLELRPVYLSEENTATIPVMLSNAGLAEGYTLYQVGIYAEDPDGGEVLYIIAQTDIISGESVPGAAESAGYSIDWNIVVKVSKASSIEVAVNEAGKLTLSQADALYLRKETMDDALSGKVDKVTGKGLSTNDFTNTYKATLDNLPDEIEQNSKIDAATSDRYGLTNGTPSQAFDRAVQILTATIPAAGWSTEANAEGWFTNQVTVTEMKAAYNPTLDLVITSAALAEDERAAFGLIMECETFDGYVIARALEIPDIDINVRFTGV